MSIHSKLYSLLEEALEANRRQYNGLPLYTDEFLLNFANEILEFFAEILKDEVVEGAS